MSKTKQVQATPQAPKNIPSTHQFTMGKSIYVGKWLGEGRWEVGGSLGTKIVQLHGRCGLGRLKAEFRKALNGQPQRRELRAKRSSDRQAREEVVRQERQKQIERASQKSAEVRASMQMA